MDNFIITDRTVQYSNLIYGGSIIVGATGQFNQSSSIAMATNVGGTSPTIVNATGQAVILPAPNNTEEKIRSFSALAVGWHYGTGLAPSQEMIATAIQWHRYLISLGFTVTDAFPGRNGEIMVTAYQGSHYIEILLESISTVSFLHERDGKEVRSLDQVTPDQVFRALGELAGEIWNTSGYSIQNISTVNVVSLRASPSRSMTTEHPSSTWGVSQGLPSASTYGNTIPTSGANRLYSGFLTKPSFQRNAA
jgi:hypothetical protein